MTATAETSALVVKTPNQSRIICLRIQIPITIAIATLVNAYA